MVDLLDLKDVVAVVAVIAAVVALCCCCFVGTCNLAHVGNFSCDVEVAAV